MIAGKPFLISIGVIQVMLAIACRESRNFADRDKETVVHEVKRMLHEYHEDVRNTGLMAEFKYLDSSADFSWLPPGFSEAIDFDSVSSLLRSSAPVFKVTDNRFDSLLVVPLSPDTASYTGRVRSTMTDTAGNTSSVSLAESGVLIRRKDGWKLLRGQTAVITSSK